MGRPGLLLGPVAAHDALRCQLYQRRVTGFWSDLLIARFATFPARRGRASGELSVLWGREKRRMKMREG
jgi:hypothetical protein